MMPITTRIPSGAWKGHAVDTVALDYDGRHRRRVLLKGASGAEYLLDLPEAAHLREGDGLPLPDGGIVRVVATPEPLLEVRAASPEALVRLGWHLGNRHLAAQVCADRILIRRDHVIAHMLAHLGAIVREVEAPFDPEGGAYRDHAH